MSADEFAKMKKEGFDHVRVPVGWHQYAGPGPDYALEPEIFDWVDFVVTNALQNKLAVMINIHHFNALDQDPVAATPEFLAIWRQVAAHYQKFPRQLAFELDNEPHENASTALMNPDLRADHRGNSPDQSPPDALRGARRLGQHWGIEKPRAAAG